MQVGNPYDYIPRPTQDLGVGVSNAAFAGGMITAPGYSGFGLPLTDWKGGGLPLMRSLSPLQMGPSKMDYATQTDVSLRGNGVYMFTGTRLAPLSDFEKMRRQAAAQGI